MTEENDLDKPNASTNKAMKGLEVAGGDIVGGDKISVSITGSTGVAIGREAQASVSYLGFGDQLGQVFANLYETIEKRPPDPEVDKAELVAIVRSLQEELALGPQANINKVQRLLRTLSELAPDIILKTMQALDQTDIGLPSSVRKLMKEIDQVRIVSPVPSYDDLTTQIDDSDLPPEKKGVLLASLGSISQEVELGEKADLLKLFTHLEAMVITWPELRQPLLLWLNERESISKPIKIVARKVLS